MVSVTPNGSATAVVCLGVLVVLLGPVVVPAVASPWGSEAELHARYDGNGSLDGEATGHVLLHRIIYDGMPPGALSIHGVAARFLLIETRYNHTNAPGAPGVIDPGDRDQDMTWSDLQADEIVIDWPHRDQDSLMVLRGPGYLDGGEAPISAAVNTTGASWSVPTIHGDGIPFMWHDGAGSPGWHPGGVPAWHRTLRLDDADAVTVDNGFVLHLRQARLAVDGEVVRTMPSFETKEAELTTPLFLASRTQTTLTEAFLHVDAGTARFPASHANLDVSEMNLTVDGDVTVSGATGLYRIVGQDGSFSKASLGLSGRFHLHDATVGTEEEDTGRGSGRATATGSFAVVAVDYIVQAVGPAAPSFVERALWATLALTALSLLGWAVKHAWVLLYSRIKENEVLEHPKRAEIMNFVEKNPGCHVLRVAGDLGLARGVARHHVMVLERAGRLRRYQESGQNMLVPAGQPKEVALRALAEEDPHVTSIRMLVATGGMRRSELVAMLRQRHGVADPTARRWIEKAVRAGLVEEAGKGHAVTVRAAS